MGEGTFVTVYNCSPTGNDLQPLPGHQLARLFYVCSVDVYRVLFNSFVTPLQIFLNNLTDGCGREGVGVDLPQLFLQFKKVWDCTPLLRLQHQYRICIFSQLNLLTNLLLQLLNEIIFTFKIFDYSGCSRTWNLHHLCNCF
jgi:hypothetical protein